MGWDVFHPTPQEKKLLNPFSGLQLTARQPTKIYIPCLQCSITFGALGCLCFEMAAELGILMSSALGNTEKLFILCWFPTKFRSYIFTTNCGSAWSDLTCTSLEYMSNFLFLLLTGKWALIGFRRKGVCMDVCAWKIDSTLQKHIRYIGFCLI